MKLPASTPLAETGWVPAHKVAGLRRIGLVTLGDLLLHFPRRHEDRRRFPNLPQVESGTPVCLHGTVLRTSAKRLGGWRQCFEAEMESEAPGGVTERWTCRWYNSNYLAKIILGGDRLVVYGKTKIKKGHVIMEHPEFEVLEEDAELSVHFGRIAPVHPAGEGVPVRLLRSLVHNALEQADLQSVPSFFPEKFLPLAIAARLPSLPDALRWIHFPEEIAQIAPARNRLVLEEFFLLQARLLHRHHTEARRKGSAKPRGSDLVRRFVRSLPFALTEGQTEVLKEICADLASERPMRRLLQGDVGSGKTVVAAVAAAQTIAAGWQAAFMAPTQILAEQHFRTLGQWLAPLGVRVALFTSERTEVYQPDLREFSLEMQDVSAASEADLLIGTHALLYESVPLSRLGLVIIDEQHKFGVLQRERLIRRGEAPDVLVMSATPIPRTLTETLHGDLDVSLLRGRPARRGMIRTVVRPQSALPKITEFLREQFAAGRQAFIVYPLVEESEKTEAKAATAEFRKWCASLDPYKVGLLHGRLPVQEKDAVMRSFAAHEFSALVATTVIEVGVDIPNANLMLIENAERFGLAQLHQMRGRVGRGEHDAWCILLTADQSPESAERLAILERTNDGFEIAEADWELRGPGDMAGTAQSGLPPFRIGDLRRDAELMKISRTAAAQIFAVDPELSAPEHLALRLALEEEIQPADSTNQ